ncbi:hypothetical protein CPC08DRAFT_709314 [Agrocybe pediades]|nr:hypothetical protein CPC08DRAFT_709314 [Agrocybe pediades]
MQRPSRNSAKSRPSKGRKRAQRRPSKALRKTKISKPKKYSRVINANRSSVIDVDNIPGKEVTEAFLKYKFRRYRRLWKSNNTPFDLGIITQNFPPGVNLPSQPLLISLALNGCDTGRLTLGGIIQHLERCSPDLKGVPIGQSRDWRNSIRNKLSSQRMFCKVPRPRGDPNSSSCYWLLDVRQDPEFYSFYSNYHRISDLERLHEELGTIDPRWLLL